VRLEDRTGVQLGELPQNPPESESEEEDDEDDEDEDAVGEWKATIQAEGGTQLDELRKLLDECHAMEAGRDEGYMFNNPAAMGRIGVGNFRGIRSKKWCM
jgi:hypothetical protein